MIPHRNTTILILGNGARRFRHHSRFNVVFTFNGAQAFARHECNVRIHTTLQPGRFALSFETSNERYVSWVSQLSQRANDAVLDHQRALGCVPSSGFSVVHALWAEFDSVVVDGVSFDPTLSRQHDLGPRKPLPQMFHNWLGERRQSYRRWLESPKHGWQWSLFEKHPDTPVRIPSISHYALLQALIDARGSGSMGTLAALAKGDIEPDIGLLGSTETVRTLESCFHLDRERSETPNWWLYEASASLIIESLAAHLRQAQRKAFRLAKLGSQAAV